MSASGNEIAEILKRAKTLDEMPESLDLLLRLAESSPALVEGSLFWLRVKLPQFVSQNPEQLQSVMEKLNRAYRLSECPVILHIASLVKLQSGDKDRALELNQKASTFNAARKILEHAAQVAFTDKSEWSGPDYFIIGAQKTATSALYAYVNRHPKILPAMRKELFYFSNKQLHAYGDAYYRSCFPPTWNGEFITGESSATYFNNYPVIDRICAAAPKAKFVLTVRNPADRAISDYHMKVRNGAESRSIQDCLIKEIQELREPETIERALQEPYYDRIDRKYVLKGLYSFPLKRLLDTVGKERVLIVDSHALQTNPSATLNEVWQFLGLEPVQDTQIDKANPVNVGGYSKEESNQIREEIADFYRPFNAEFQRLAGISINWE